MVDYEADLALRGGTWDSPDLPFAINDFEVDAVLRPGSLEVDRAQGTNGRTVIRAAGVLDPSDPDHGPLDLILDVNDLEFDGRLQAKSPPELAPLWGELSPSGRFDVYLAARRRQAGGELDFGVTLDLNGVSITYAASPYPLKNLTGRIIFEDDRLTIEPPGLHTIIGNRPARCWGTIDRPGDQAVVSLDFEIGALPIDETLMAALAPDVRRALQGFNPQGTVRVAGAHLDRRPPPPGSEEEIIVFSAELDLGMPEEAGGFAFTWEGLPYPITKVRGRLSILPDRWEFHDLTGENGLTRIACPEGWVRQTGPDRFDAELTLSARDLLFNEQLLEALPVEWRATWGLLDPRGKAALDASIRVEGNENHTRLAVRPDPGTSIRLSFTPTPAEPGGPEPPPIALPAMEEIAGTFVYDDGLVTMEDVGFDFRGSPVQFRSGIVQLEPDGRFGLGVDALRIAQFRLDAELRRLMPGVMADFARRLDESPPIPSMRGDLRLGWSGKPGDPAWVEWEDGLVVLDGQTIRAGVPLEDINGRLAGFKGRFDGRSMSVSGRVDLDSLVIGGTQLTRVQSPIVVDADSARFDAIRGDLLDGLLTGQVRIGLDAEPDFAAALAIVDADLARFTATIPGEQSFRGLLSGQLAFDGVGSDPHSIRGQGDFRIAEGDLGDLPIALRFFKFLNTLDIAAPRDKTAFDAAEVSVRIEDGLAYLNPIALSGDAISLRGSGTMDLRGQLDLRLRILYGREGRLRVPLFSDAVREAAGQIVDLRVTGPASYPMFNSKILPGGQRMLRDFGAGLLGRGDRAPLSPGLRR